jgi:hypothetical protein
VALAIALGREPPHHDDPPEGPDSFLADNGFEYIDGERTRHPEMLSASVTAEDGDGNDDDDSDDVQGLPRVVDALSTIMWPTMIREPNGGGGGKRNKTQLQASLFDFDDVPLRADAENNGEPDDDEEEILAALMAADAADNGLPLTRASRMQREMQALERWLVENEEMHEAEFGRGTGIDDDDVDGADEGENKDEGDDDDKGDGGGETPLSSSIQAPVLNIRAPPNKDDDPWVAPSASNNPTPSASTSTTAQQQPSTAAPPSGSSSGFDDDFSAFVSAPPAVSSFPVCGLASARAPTSTSTSESGSGSRSLAPVLPHSISQSLLKPSHTGGSFRSLRSAASDVADIGDDLLGYEALDDRSSVNFSPEHEHEHERGTRTFGDDAEPGTSTTGQRFGGRAPGLGDVSFDLTNILSTLDTMREDMAGIEDEGERRARTARFASEFVFKGMSVDGGRREEIED